jgi:septal ring factor EnvC (AmiA/AmiB activator)
MTRLGSSLIKAMRQAAEGERVNILYIGEAVKENATAKWAYNFHASGTVPYVEKSALDQSQAKIKELEQERDDYKCQLINERDDYMNEHIAYTDAQIELNACHEKLLQSQRELEACKQMLSVARKALEKAKVEYWNKCYAGSGTIKAMTLSEFDRMIDEALAKIAALKPTKEE